MCGQFIIITDNVFSLYEYNEWYVNTEHLSMSEDNLKKKRSRCDITLIDILYKEVVFYNDMVIDFYFHVWFI